jgi:DNA-binding NtrC family response regulator
MQQQQRQEEISAEMPFNMPNQGATQSVQSLDGKGMDRLPTLAEWNAKYIDYVLSMTKGKKTAAARILGINRRTLYRRNKNHASSHEEIPESHKN